MDKSSYYVDTTDNLSVQELIDAFHVESPSYEDMIRRALALHDKPFVLHLNPVRNSVISPLQDAFTFNMETDELILFTNDPEALIDAIIEMAMFLRGFSTVMGVDDEWKVQVAIGAWRRVRESLKDALGIVTGSSGQTRQADPALEAVDQYNQLTFGAMVFLASHSDIEVVFPEGSSKLCISAYERLSHIMNAIALNIGLADYPQFNRRLGRALLLIEDSILPKNSSPFDDLFGPDGFSDAFFEDDSEN